MRHKVTPALLLLAVAASACNLLGPRSPSEEGVSFRTSDGFLLEGNIFGSGRKAVVLSHGFPEDQSSWFDTAQALADEGYLVLTYNFRGYGKSQGRKDISLLGRDVTAAIRFLTKEKSRPDVALIGASMGGTASIVAASDSQVEAVATLSAPLEFRELDASTAIGAVTAHKLFVASVGDREASESAKQLLRLSRDPQSDIKLFPGDAHGTDMVEGKKGDEIRMDLVRFLKDAFG